MNKIDVMVLHVNRTKDGKTVLQYGINTPDTANGYGMAILTQWFDSLKPYENLRAHKMTLLSGEYEFSSRISNGFAKQILVAIYDGQGTNLLA